jgi:adenylate cyclase
MFTIEFRYFQEERRQKQQISKTFGQYIPTELVKEMNETGQSVGVGGESKELTVLFSDVRGFTTISESVEPSELTQLMNGFLTPMTHVIHENRGTIDKYMGDAVMAFWGAPLDDPNHAEHAVKAALEMIEAMKDLRTEFKSRGWPEINIGVGLNTGPMNVGNMGSEFRLAYTVLGDAVNLGARLEGLTKNYGVQIIISEFTQAAVPRIACRELDKVKVKGKDLPVTIVEPIGLRTELDEKTQASLDAYHAALALYRAQEWGQAEAGFKSLQRSDAERMIYEIYLDRLSHFRENPPGENWDGVYTHTSK